MTNETPIHFTLQIEAGTDSDESNVDRLTRNLFKEIRNTDVEDAQIPFSAVERPGAKGDPITVGVVALAVLPAAIPALIVFAQSWLLRQQNQMVKIKIGETEVEIPRDLSEAELERIVNQVKQLSGNE